MGPPGWGKSGNLMERVLRVLVHLVVAEPSVLPSSRQPYSRYLLQSHPSFPCCVHGCFGCGCVFLSSLSMVCPCPEHHLSPPVWWASLFVLSGLTWISRRGVVSTEMMSKSGAEAFYLCTRRPSHSSRITFCSSSPCCVSECFVLLMFLSFLENRQRSIICNRVFVFDSH